MSQKKVNEYQLEAIWKSNREPGKYWSPQLGTFEIEDNLEYVRVGNAALTRRIKQSAKYVVMEKNKWGNKPTGYFANQGIVSSIEAELSKKPTAQEQRYRRFERRYCSWREALPDASEMLFNLNRYAKHRSCSPANRDEIYDLKNDFVELLYKEGYCTEAWKHYLDIPSKMCWRCEGTGEDWYGLECERCDGTGIYRESYEVEFVCFRFRVGETNYTWHQPSADVDFDVSYTHAEQRWQSIMEEKTVELPPRKRTEAKDLIRWVIREAWKTEQNDRYEGNVNVA